MAAWLRVGGAALVCAGLGLGLAACGGDTGIASPAVSSAVPTTSSAPAARAKHPSVTGRITAENGTSWVVTTKAGKQVTVMITTNTKFGTAASPATEQQFTVGSTVRIAGDLSGTTVTATRIVVPTPKPSQSATPSPTPTA